MPAAPRPTTKNPSRRSLPRPAPVNPSLPAPANRRVLWLFVGLTTLVIAGLWFVLVGANLNRTSEGDESLYARIKREIQSVFSSDASKNEANGTLSNAELTNLEQRVFPNVNIHDSGTFTTP